MDFKTIPLSAQPAFSWIWNTKITKNEICRQIDELYDFGVRAFYILAEPKEFRPKLRKTYLEPDFMSSEYLDLLYFAYEYGKSKGMQSWLYNEGGWPSGMVCGQIRNKHPELAMKGVFTQKEILPANTAYKAPTNLISAFVDDKRIYDGKIFNCDVEVTSYVHKDMQDPTTSMRTSIAERRNTDLFLEMMHEKLKSRFGSAMGSEIKIMFDDEAHMGTWANNFDKIFFNKYGYDLKDFMPYIANSKIPTKTLEQARARSDYFMLLGEIMRKNYFKPMREWLNKNNMYSVGHLGGDNTTYHENGNILATLREYDIPGIDEIWNQITYPYLMEYRGKDVKKSCKQAYEFFPRIASSAAHQIGRNVCVSEALSVSGSYLPPEEIRYVVNYQAVRGINLYNFMLISFARTGVLPLQYRPNYIAEFPGSSFMKETIDYTARISHILQSGKTNISAALYYPQRTIFANGEIGEAAGIRFEELGDMLEAAGVEFDIIDEDFVKNAVLENGALKSEHVTYTNVFSPNGDLEYQDIIDKLAKTNKEIIPSIIRSNKKLLSRTIIFDDNSKGLFVVNTDGATVSDTIEIKSDKIPYLVDLNSGDICECDHEKDGDKIKIPVKLLRGEAVMIWLPNTKQQAKSIDKLEEHSTITSFDAKVIRQYYLDDENGITNKYYTDGKKLDGLGEWNADFSGEVEYSATLDNLAESNFVLDLGEVRHYARVFLNDKLVGETTIPPYRVKIDNANNGDQLKIIVSNTAANANRIAKYLTKQERIDIGPYNGFMTVAEQNAPCGGLLGPVKILKIKD